MVATCLLALVGCSDKPADPVTPTIVGVVESSDDELVQTPVVQLSDGTNYDLTGATPLVGRGPRQGELLIAGEQNDGERWYHALTADDSRCPFRVSGKLWEEPDAVVLEFGLRLLKADDYEPPDLPLESYGGLLLCVNEHGEVIGEA